MTYAQLTRFMLPLMLTALVQELSGQFLNGGMARMPRATETLAAFGLAYGIASLLSGILTQARQLSLVLVEHTRATALSSASRSSPGSLSPACSPSAHSRP